MRPNIHRSAHAYFRLVLRISGHSKKDQPADTSADCVQCNTQRLTRGIY